MLGDLIQMDVPSWIQYVAIIAGIIAAGRIIVGLPIRWTTERVADQVDEYIDRRIDDKLAPIIETQRLVRLDVKSILEQLSENHGTSALDKINDTKHLTERIANKVLDDDEKN